jgi:hypothetical protein
MAEKKVVVENIGIAYEGIMDVNAIYNFIDHWVADRGWDKNDVMHEVRNKETHREIFLDLRPAKIISDYVKYQLITKATFSNIVDTEVEIDGKKMKLQKGSVKLAFRGVMITDWEGDLQSNAKVIILKTIYDKFIYRRHMADFEGSLKDEVYRLRNEVSSYLNITKYANSRTRVMNGPDPI